MFDPWGVGEAMQHGMRMFSHAKRATGRSTMLIQMVQNHDTVVFAQRAEADRMRRLFAEAGKREVYTIVKDPNQGLGDAYDYIAANYNRRGTLHYDHSWFEAIYFYEIRRIMDSMEHFNAHMVERRQQAVEDEKRHRAPQPRWDGTNAADAAGGGSWDP